MEKFTHIFTRKWKVTCDPMFTFVIYLLVFAPDVIADDANRELVTSVITIRYNDTTTAKVVQETEAYGHFAVGSKIDNASGILIRVDPAQLCSAINATIVPKKKWIALIQRGTCDFIDKIQHAAIQSNASAVVIYNNKKPESEGLHLPDGRMDIISIFIEKFRGDHLLDVLDKDVEVYMKINIGQRASSTTPSNNNSQFTANNTSVLFVSISFIVLIIISLAWLVFYYIQRCRYTNAKERLSRRLANAAKKAIAKIPQRSVKQGDKELDSEADQCAVCIEPYKLSDVIRVLPCKHVFHKSCVDPWLLDQRSCPMCKMDILRAFGMHLNGSQESVPQDQEIGALASSPIMGEPELLSTSEDQGAVGGLNILLYQRPGVRYLDRGGHYLDRNGHYLDRVDRHFHDSELSSEGSLECGGPSRSIAQCHVECTNDIILENRKLSDEPSLARSTSVESLHASDLESNEIDALMPAKGGGVEEVCAKIRRKSSGSSGSQSFIHDPDIH